MNLIIKVALSSLLLLCLNSGHAITIQILTTGDLHSYFKASKHHLNEGGYVAVKNTLDHLRNEAQLHGIQTLTLDSGDFSEGQIYYLAGKGSYTFQIHDRVGYDAIALGNHDFYIGLEQLDDLLGRVKMNTPILSANIIVDNKYSEIKQSITPYKELEIAGKKIAILGLTTTDIFYQWFIRDGAKFENIHSAAAKYTKLLRERGNDIIIGLTHIGLSKDIELARFNKNFDVIVGGHSHTELARPTYVKHGSKQIPIVHTGSHGKYIGRSLLNIDDKNKLKVLS